MTTMQLLFLSTGSATGGDDVKAPDFTLQDQFDRTVSLRQFAGRLVVLIASDNEGSAQNPEWIKAVRERCGERVTIQGIANVSSVPFFLKGKIRSDFKKDEASILLDWKGEVFQVYGLAKGVSNVVLIDRDGNLRHRESGPALPEAVQRLYREMGMIERQ
jgi:predicted transcriptional regulator